VAVREELRTAFRQRPKGILVPALVKKIRKKKKPFEQRDFEKSRGARQIVNTRENIGRRFIAHALNRFQLRSFGAIAIGLGRG